MGKAKPKETRATNLLMVKGISTLHYVVDARLSRFTVEAFAGGLLSAFAHSPKFGIREITSDVLLDPEDLRAAWLHMEIRTDSVELLDEVSDKDHREIERVMREEALEAATYPVIVFDSTSVSPSRIAEGQYSLTLGGDLSLHGVTQRLKVPLRVAFSGDRLRAFGEFSLKQTDYGIKLVTVAGGAIKVKNALKLSFDLVARRTPACPGEGTGRNPSTADLCVAEKILPGAGKKHPSSRSSTSVVTIEHSGR